MNVPVLFGCPLCAVNSTPIFTLSFCLGGVLASYVLLKPFVKRVSKIWGWPRLTVNAGVGLLAMLCWPTFLCWYGLQMPNHHSVSRITICTAGLVICAVYLWVRGTWLLEQCHAATWFRQILFHGVLWAGMLIVGTFIGLGLVGLVFLGIVWPGWAFGWFIAHAGLGAFLGLFVYLGLHFVFLTLTW